MNDRLTRARLTLVVMIAAAVIAAGCAQDPHGAPVRVIVPPGVTFAAASDSLARAGIIGSPRWFALYAKLRRSDHNIKPGTYLLQRGTSWNEALAALTSGKGLLNTITIPEGFELREIVPLMVKQLHVPLESAQAAVRDTTLLHELDVPSPTLEGYLFPDTYGFPEGTTARRAVTEMVHRFERAWKPVWTEQLAQMPLTRHDIVTLASIIEKEAKLPEERSVISAVYHNRLTKGMLLQADPTVQYARGLHTDRVLFADLDIESPYNTYKHPGLPPGPIASPGAASIEAALFPANVPYLFFVAYPDGHHEFRTTFGEHEKAVKTVRAIADSVRRDSIAAARKKGQASSPTSPAKKAPSSSHRTTRRPAR